MRRPTLLVALLMALAVGVMFVPPLLANDVDCFSDKYAGDIRISENLPKPAAETVQQASDVAMEQSFARGALGRAAEVADIRYGTIAAGTLGLDGKAAFVIAILSDVGPYPMLETPMGNNAPMVEAPCQLVVLTPEGEYLFSYQMQFDVDVSSPDQ